MYSKRTLLSIGIMIFLLLVVEFNFTLFQPVSNLGFSFELKDGSFYVHHVVKDTPAYGLIKKGTRITSINNTFASALLVQRKGETEEAFKKDCSSFFKFGQTLTIVDNYKRSFTITLEKLPYFKRIHGLPYFVKVKFLLAFMIILNAIIIPVFIRLNKEVMSIVYGLFFLALATANLFNSDFTSLNYSVMVNVLLDFGIFFNFAFIFAYFSKIFEYAEYINPFKYLKFVPPLVLLVKYILLFTLKMDFIDNPLNKIDAIFVETCCLIIFMLFLLVTITFQKTLTVIFKFFILGLVFAAAPLLVDHFSYLLSHSVIMSEDSKTFSITGFLFVPFMLDLALLQSRKILKPKLASVITSYLAFIVIIMPCYFTVRSFLPFLYKNVFAACSLLVSPLIFTVIYKVTYKFFSYNSQENKNKISDFRSLIASVQNLEALNKITALELNREINNSYIFFYKKDENDNWNFSYLWGEITPEEIEQKSEECINKKRIICFNDGSFSVPILRENVPTGFAYIGPKKNGDFYLSGEYSYVEDILRAFHKHFVVIKNNQLLEEIQENNLKVSKMQDNVILELANLIESRDGGTGAHVRRTGAYAELIAKIAFKEGLYKDTINEIFLSVIYKAAALHDVGKIVVPDAVLRKPGKLTDEEFEQMKRHTTEGEKIVKQIFGNSDNNDLIEMTGKIALSHHEKWNGTGYPNGICGESIPLCARIVSIADAFDAIVSPRCYKSSKTPEEAFEIIKNDAGIHFDPVLASLFLENKDQVCQILNRID